MKYSFVVFGLALLLQSCDLQKKSDFTPLVPDDTPFIVGVLEATEDTVHHYPEVYVGTVSNPQNFETDLVWTTEGIWWPVTNALVTRPVTRNDFERTADTEAKVEIKGPLGSTDETTVQLKHEGKGVYGDTQYQLLLEGGEEYKLSVIMSDGRQYTANTRIPELFEWNVPDSITMELELGQYYTGIYNEKDKELAHFPFSVDSEVGYLVFQSNSEYDHYNLNVPKGGFFFEDRGNFLREGSAYSLLNSSTFPDEHMLGVGWDGSADTPLRNSENRWLSVSQLNIPLSKFYYSVFRFVGTNPGGRWERQDQSRLNARVERDTDFLFNISNIIKVNKNGNVLPEEQADAIGVFGGYSAAYRNLTVYPERSWDSDTLNWGNQGN